MNLVFVELKSIFTSDRVVKILQLDNNLILKTTASITAIGSMLKQYFGYDKAELLVHSSVKYSPDPNNAT